MFGWNLLKKINCWEFWKTSSCFLVCFKYQGIFKFFKKEKDAENCFNHQIKTH
jgi:hypothetical protein